MDKAVKLPQARTTPSTPSLLSQKVEGLIRTAYADYLECFGAAANKYAVPPAGLDLQYLIGADSDAQQREIDKIHDAAQSMKAANIPEYKQMTLIAARMERLSGLHGQIDLMFNKQVNALVHEKGGQGHFRQSFEMHLQNYFLQKLQTDIFPKLCGDHKLNILPLSSHASVITAGKKELSELAQSMRELIDVPGGELVATNRLVASREEFCRDLCRAVGIADLSQSQPR